MYTQCPKCETVFKMSAEVLRTAGGQVRCGQCGEVFNALARLAEDASAFVKPESPLEMEARADRILASSGAPRAASPPPPAPTPAPPAASPSAPAQDTEDEIELFEFSGELARLQVIDPPSESLEFSLPPTELERVFVSTKAKRGSAPPPGDSAAEPPPAAAPARTPRSTPTGTPPGPSGSPAPTRRPASPGAAAPPAAPSAAAPTTAPAPSTPSPRGELGGSSRARATDGAPVSVAEEAALPPHPESRAAQAARMLEESTDGGALSEQARRAMLAGLAETSLPALERPARTIYAWLAAAIVLGALLLGQIFYSGSGWLGRTLSGSPDLQRKLTAYQQQVWGVTGEPGASGTLRVRASLLNASAQLQPYPLLRITLTDRFGNRIGTRDFEPAEYLGRPTVKMLAPGERVDATLEIEDPGREAEGYELDVCLRAEQRVVCAAEPPAGTR